MDNNINVLLYVHAIITACGGLMGVWGFIEVLKNIKKSNDDEHDRRKRWDEAADAIEKYKDKWNQGLTDIYSERNKIVEKYDARLDELEKRIDQNHTETEAKMQEVQSEIIMLTECMRAVLDGLHQQGCNGRVTEASEKLDNYLVGLIGK